MKKRKINKAKKVSSRCRNHGSCSYCKDSRTYQSRKELDKWNFRLAGEMMYGKEVIITGEVVANDGTRFEDYTWEEHLHFLGFQKKHLIKEGVKLGNGMGK